MLFVCNDLIYKVAHIPGFSRLIYWENLGLTDIFGINKISYKAMDLRTKLRTIVLFTKILISSSTKALHLKYFITLLGTQSFISFSFIRKTSIVNDCLPFRWSSFFFYLTKSRRLTSTHNTWKKLLRDTNIKQTTINYAIITQ